MSARSVSDEIDRRARRSYGLVTRAEVDELASRSMRRTLVERGALRTVHPGVYRVSGAPPSWEQAVLAACLASGHRAHASHLTAAALWQMQAPDQAHGAAIHVVSPRERRVRLDGVIAHQSMLLPALDLTVHRRIPVLTPARTIVECSSTIGTRTTGLWIDHALRRTAMDLLDLRSCVARLAGPGRRKLSIVREALAQRLPGYDPGDSELEVRALRILAAAGLPRPVQQHRVRLADGRHVRLDLAYPERLVAIELDGWDTHGVRSAFDRDRVRANEIVVLGWHLLRFSSTMVDQVLVRQVRAALEPLAHAH